MSNRLIILGVAIVAALYVVFSSIYIVNEREQAIVMRFGQITDIRTEPGLYFKIPTDIVDTVQIIENRLLRYDIANMTVQVSGNAFYRVDAFLTYRISDPRLFRERAPGQLSVAEDRIGTRFDSALRQVYGLREFNAALSEQRPQMMREARDLIRPDMAELGIEVVDVRILRTDLDQDVSATTFERMRARRLAEAALLRARGQEQAQSLRAIADRQAVEIVAAATRDAEIIRGTGDAERNRLFAAAYGQDQEFFEFFRSMQSYRTALTGTGTTMVLSPDSEFFRYFGSNGEIPAANTNLAPPLPLVPVPDAPTTSDEPALDGTGIEDSVAPTMTLEDGSRLAPTVGTEAPPAVEVRTGSGGYHADPDNDPAGHCACHTIKINRRPRAPVLFWGQVLSFRIGNPVEHMRAQGMTLGDPRVFEIGPRVARQPELLHHSLAGQVHPRGEGYDLRGVQLREGMPKCDSRSFGRIATAPIILAEHPADFEFWFGGNGEVDVARAGQTEQGAIGLSLHRQGNGRCHWRVRRSFYRSGHRPPRGCAWRCRIA
ncbi:protease modulator HflC [Devosia sp. A8/3-2]|nr:protease modulator HflC [Devosia sp. A8/3-2]